MSKLEPLLLRPWTLPFIVLALIGPPIAGFSLGGPPLGLAIGAIAVTAIIVLAARARFDEPIEVARTDADAYPLLVVALAPVEDPQTAGEVVAIARDGAAASGSRAANALVLAPATNTRVAHWLSDLGRARFDAQRRLALSLGTLAAAGLEASGRVGDSEPVQAVEDALHTWPAREVVFVTPPGAGGAEIDEVRRRLDRPVRRVEPGQATSSKSRA